MSQAALDIETGAPDHGRMREHEVDLTPTPVVRQALTWLAELHEPSDILDPSAGSGVFGMVARELWPAAHSTAVEIRDEERAALASVYDDVYLGDFREVVPARCRGRARFDLIATNPPFSLFVEMAELGLSLLSPTGYLMLLGLTDVMSRAKAKVAWCIEHPPAYELRIGGAVKFRNGINPNTGRPYTADQRSYSFWVWEMETMRGGRPGRSWSTYQLPMLPSADRRWSVPPGRDGGER